MLTGLTASHPPVPATALALLTGAVVLAHALVLQNLPLYGGEPAPLSTRVFTTRTLTIQAPPPVAKPPPVVTAAAPPAPRPVRQPPREPIAALMAAATPAPASPTPLPDQVPEAIPEPLPDTLPASQAEPPSETQAESALPEAPASAPAMESDLARSDAAPEPTAPETAVAATGSAAASLPLPVAPMELTRNALAPTDSGAVTEPRTFAVPGSTRLKFNATGQRGHLSYQALGEMSWQHDGSRYQARMEMGAFLIGMRVLSSTGSLTVGGVTPERFSDRFRSERAAHFDRDKGRVVFSANTPEAVLQGGAQDQLSVFVQLAAMVGGEPHNFPQGTSITIQTVGPRSADNWVFTVGPSETQYLPGGQLETIRLTREPRKEYDQKAELWLAPALSYLPARIRITFANGDFVDQQWRTTAEP